MQKYYFTGKLVDIRHLFLDFSTCQMSFRRFEHYFTLLKIKILNAINVSHETFLSPLF
jgi:hypothetical protein